MHGCHLKVWKSELGLIDAKWRGIWQLPVWEGEPSGMAAGVCDINCRDGNSLGSAVSVRTGEVFSSVYKSSSECARVSRSWSSCECMHGRGASCRCAHGSRGQGQLYVTILLWGSFLGTHPVVGTREIAGDRYGCRWTYIVVVAKWKHLCGSGGRSVVQLWELTTGTWMVVKTNSGSWDGYNWRWRPVVVTAILFCIIEVKYKNENGQHI